MAQDDDPAFAETQSPALAQRPVVDPRARDVARAKIANALFATNQQVKLGRYHLLERVGEGGMGVVWGAYDPELERRVAIKLVRAKAGASRERILLEGQALAKLSHPNVVAVYDVGVVDDEVYLVMEWIRGHNLRVHCAKPRTVREIVALYRAAGEGLYAAHRAGLVHRDFKPENVMVGDDGRVRVLDFGLALDRDDGDEGNIAGTPRYMAPEQQRGDEVTERADQFGFGTALREALVARNADGREAAVPGWLASIAGRATQPPAGDRYPSLAELLRALSRDPATVWRRRALAGGAVAAAVAAFAIGSLRADGPEPCGGSGDELARTWNPTVRARILAHARTLGPYGIAEAQRLDATLADYGERWIGAHRNACLAHRRDEITPRLYERGLSCFVRAHAALGAVVDVLERATADTYPNAVATARALPPTERCIADAVDSTVLPPERSIAPLVQELDASATRARYLALAGDPNAVAVASPVAASADHLAYSPLIARAQLALGAALAIDDATLAAAVTAYAKSAAHALAASDDVLFVEAFARQLFGAGRLDPDRVPPGSRDLAASIPLVETIARRAGRSASFARTLLYNNAGTTRLAAGDPQGARAWFAKAREELQAGATGVELFAALGNLATVVASADERRQLFAEQRAGLERTLGPTHAFTLIERFRAGVFTDNPREAAATLAEVCSAFATWYPHMRDRIAKCNYELGWLLDERGDRTAARRAYEAVAATGFGNEHLIARASLALFEGKTAEAARAAEVIIADASAANAWFARFPFSVDAWSIVAAARLESGKPERAIAALSAALDVMADSRINQQAARYQRRLARTKAQLATLLSRAAPNRAAELAKQAIETSRALGGYEARIRELEQLTTAAGSR
jgi:hypothetical protein